MTTAEKQKLDNPLDPTTISQLNPGTLAVGAITGSTPAGQGIAPTATTFQSYTAPKPVATSPVAPATKTPPVAPTPAPTPSKMAAYTSADGVYHPEVINYFPTAGQIANGDIPGYDPKQEAAYAKQESDILATQAPIDEQSIRDSAIQKFQTEIDALDRYYADMKKQKLDAETVVNNGRLGSAAAIQAKRGLIGSDFGAAQVDTINKNETDIKNSISDVVESEHRAAVQALLGQARQSADDEIKAKQAAKVKGAEDYIAFLKGAAQRKEDRINAVIANMLTQKVNPDDASLKALADQLGIDLPSLKTKISDAKAAALKAAADNLPKPIVVNNIAYQMQPDGTLKALTPADTKAETQVLDGVLYQKNASGVWEKVAGETAPKTQVLDGVLYQQDKDGNWIKVAGTASPPKAETQVIGDYLYERQPDGTWKRVAGISTPKAPEVRQVGSSLFQQQPDGTWKKVASDAGAPETQVVDGQLFERQPDGTWKKVAGDGSTANPPTQVIGGYLYERQPDGTWKSVAGSSAATGGKIVSVNGIDYMQAPDGTLSIPNTPEAPKNQTSELKTQALTAAQSLLQKFNSGKGTSAVGKSGTLNSFGYGLIPGTDRANFVNDFNSLKALLSLENVKLLRGQGVISDSERQLLAQAATKLDLAQSEDEFKSTLVALVNALSSAGNPDVAGTGAGGGVTPTQKPIDESDPDVQFLRQNGATDAEIRATLGFNSESQTSNKGTLSMQYESGGNPGAIGYDSTGGYSYGLFQLAHGNAKSFIDSSLYAASFKGLTFNSPAWRQQWQNIAQKDPQGFANAQVAYIDSTHVEPQVQKVESAGLDLSKYTPALRDVIASVAIQHGPGTDVVTKVLKKLGPNPDEKALIKAIYAERWAGGARFASSTPEVRQGVYNRFFGPTGEMNAALALVDRYGQNYA